MTEKRDKLYIDLYRAVLALAIFDLTFLLISAQWWGFKLAILLFGVFWTYIQYDLLEKSGEHFPREFLVIDLRFMFAKVRLRDAYLSLLLCIAASWSVLRLFSNDLPPTVIGLCCAVLLYLWVKSPGFILYSSITLYTACSAASIFLASANFVRLPFWYFVCVGGGVGAQGLVEYVAAKSRVERERREEESRKSREAESKAEAERKATADWAAREEARTAQKEQERRDRKRKRKERRDREKANRQSDTSWSSSGKAHSQENRSEDDGWRSTADLANDTHSDVKLKSYAAYFGLELGKFSERQLKDAYRKKAKETHPNAGGTGWAETDECFHGLLDFLHK